MDRLACVDVPALPLQLLLRRRPEWRGWPAAVVAEDRPQGLVLWVNEEARRLRVLPGARFAAARALAPDLRAGEVAPEEIAAGVAALADRLRRFTPEVEPAPAEPGVLWLNAAGLAGLHPSLRDWAEKVLRDLARQGFAARMVVGFSRFGTYAVARSARGLVVFDEPASEGVAARRVPLDRLGLPPDLRDTLLRLGVRSVEDFLRLPEGGLAQRFGPAAERLHRLARGDLHDPLAPERVDDPPRERHAWEHPESDATRLLFLVKRMLHPLLLRTADRREAVVELEMALVLEGGKRRVERIRPAVPTLDAAQLLDLVHLRLESMHLPEPHGAVEMRLTARGVPAEGEQLRLFAERPKRDLRAADRALARLRAEFGPEAVVRARLLEGHLPEARFAWEPLERATLPKLRSVREPCLVRRILAHPLALPPRARQEPDGWLLRGLEHGPVVKVSGPYVVAGGWWAGPEVRREYHFAETARGDLLWAFHDPRRRRWFLQGEAQ